MIKLIIAMRIMGTIVIAMTKNKMTTMGRMRMIRTHNRSK